MSSFFTIAPALNSSMLRTIGGQLVRAGEYPYMVSLQVNPRNYCGGTLISKTMVVTAAHCTDRQNTNTIKVVVGTVDLSSDDGQRLDIKRIIVHQEYVAPSKNYDIALLQLTEAVEFNENVRSIALPDEHVFYLPNTIGTTCGFGFINEYKQRTTRLRCVRVQLWGPEYCNGDNIPRVTENMICAGLPSGQQGSCPGDSGGPFVIDNKLVGIVSWGFGCGAVHRPTVYTNVPRLRKWIDHYLTT
ncbi:trypsin 3A1-like [Drosophila willistoni]|uniref:trypsin 3A1-like n=1 Tax=Drosophila willistoni TaxID=7260 RepID=UPI000C26D1B0|nr:trypsin 3A1-like [Drosophila willistoni]